ncbi:MAG: hypothetical protein LH645_05620 [Actinomycetia bacterium]|nr:hypothetical protein [Actinomycetes bacterium]
MAKQEIDMVEARGVVIATALAALLVLGLLAFAASTLMPNTIRQQACQSVQLPASECD